MFCNRVIFQLLRHRQEFQLAQEQRIAAASGAMTSSSPYVLTEWITDYDPGAADSTGNIISAIVVEEDPEVSSERIELDAYRDSHSTIRKGKDANAYGYDEGDGSRSGHGKIRRRSASVQVSEWVP